MMFVLRYRGAGRVWNVWEYNPYTKTVLATLVFGTNKPVQVEVPVCSLKRPVKGAFPVIRKSEGDWILAPAMYSRDGFQAATLAPDIPLETFQLFGAPDLISEELMEL